MNQDNDRFLWLKLSFPVTTALISAWKAKRQAKRREWWRKEREWAEKEVKKWEKAPRWMFITRVCIPILIILPIILLVIMIGTGYHIGEQLKLLLRVSLEVIIHYLTRSPQKFFS